MVLSLLEIYQLALRKFEAARKVSSNSQLYKQAGNSVTVPVIAAIAKKLKEVEEKDESIK